MKFIFESLQGRWSLAVFNECLEYSINAKESHEEMLYFGLCEGDAFVVVLIVLCYLHLMYVFTHLVKFG